MTPGRSIAPMLCEKIRNPRYRPHIVIVRAKIPPLGMGFSILPKTLRQKQITRKRFEHMLPRPHAVRVADGDSLALRDGPHDIGHETICRPVAAADHIAGTRRGETHGAVLIPGGVG